MRCAGDSLQDDTIPHLNCCCGREPEAAYGSMSIISCSQCKMQITVETGPILRDHVRQREHEMWRSVHAWNLRQTGKV